MSEVINVRFKPYEILNPAQRQKSKAYLVNKLRKAVFNWRNQGYPNTTKTTQRLLEFWFKEEHILENKPFQFWFAQREAIETLIYVYEVLRKRRVIELAQDFGEGRLEYNPEADVYPLYCFKMATGTGKTFVMAFSIVWSYFNNKFEGLNDYTNKFLLITPNVIVYERLKRDFQEARIFRNYPFIPSEWLPLFDLRVVLREDTVPRKTENILFLTNIQQLEEKRTKRKKIEKEIEDIFGLEEVSRSYVYKEERIREVIEEFPNLMILKDEAHHIYNLEKAWKKILVNLHNKLQSNFGVGINVELDFTATPKTEQGKLFPWIITDFSLKEAVEMGIVKYPLKGVISQPQVFESKKISDKFRRWIDASIKRWQEYKKALEKVNKKSILFIQCPTNKDADDVYEYLIKLPEIEKDKVLLIHTDNTGEIKKSELEKLRKEAKTIDDDSNPREIIISTMMLNEGWDVKNVNIILGLRSYESTRRVLPEQVIGRGLRKMFLEYDPDPKRCINTLEIIGPPALLDVIDELEKEEGIKIGAIDIEEKPPIITIFVDENKLEKDIKIPFLEPKYIRVELELNEDDFEKLPKANILFEDKVLEERIIYTARTLEGIEVVKREWTLPVPKDIGAVIGYYADQIRKELKLPKSFADFYPFVERYVKEKLFNKQIEWEQINEEQELEKFKILYNLIKIGVKEKLLGIFRDYFKNKLFNKREVMSFTYKNFSSVKPFIWPKFIISSDKCIFNYCPCDNNLECDFAEFLNKAEDVEAFTKNEGIGFFIEYVNYERLLRNYKPDFIVRLDNGEHWIVETKGLKDVDVELKDKRAIEWCKDASNLTGINWSFIRIDEDKFRKISPRVILFRDFINILNPT